MKTFRLDFNYNQKRVLTSFSNFLQSSVSLDVNNKTQIMKHVKTGYETEWSLWLRTFVKSTVVFIGQFRSVFMRNDKSGLYGEHVSNHQNKCVCLRETVSVISEPFRTQQVRS